MPHGKVRSKIALTVLALLVCGFSHAADDEVQVVPGPALKLWWQSDPATPNNPPRYPADAIKNGVEGCLAVAFEIHGDGSTSNERVWHSSLNVRSDKQLEQAALRTVHQWRFVPSATNTSHTPVYTCQIVTFTLKRNGTGGTKYDQLQQVKLEAKCKINDFVQQVQRMISAAAKAKGSKP